LSNYLRELYQIPGVAETVNMHHIKEHYYRSHPSVNIKRFVAIGPDLAYLEQPHDRGRLMAEGPAWMVGG
ncbi:MAG: glutathione S-transferase family protein, partial [Myxococcota bacterium]